MKFLFVGDVMLGRLVNDILRERPPVYPWGNTLPIFQGVDVRICNLECVISDKGTPWLLTPKVFHFGSDARNVETLKIAGVDAVSLANNHALDYGYDAMLDMLKILDDAGIHHAGAGVNFEEASRPAIFEIGRKKIGFIAFTDNEPDGESATEIPGVFYVPIDIHDKRAKRLFEIVRQTREKTDFLIVSTHWGPNWGYRPQPEHIPFGHTLIDAGADVVFGHSCHVFQGIEIYNDRPVIYSAGDFIDDYAVDEIERNDQSFIFTLETHNSKIIRLRLYPTVISDFQARLATQNEAKEITDKMRQLCAEFKTPARCDEKEGCIEILVSS
mgnify:CR=1 FL=1